MNPPDRRDSEIAALRERLSRLSQASLRITGDLDFNYVLQGALDSARSLTGARYGVIVLHDGAGVAEEFLSSGMTPEETERLWTAPGWPSHFQYLAGLPSPLRVPDLPGHLRSQGLPELQPPVEVSPRVSFLAFPMQHQGERVGSIYLAEKHNGQEFTQEDEDTLALFAGQVALAIANARRYRDERRARADLETLVDTSPVGVVVFDAATGLPKSFNREARRIVDSLRNPDQTPELLLEALTFRRSDGREVSLRGFPMPGLLSTGETVRAEEIVMAVPDGRSVTALINATPIFSAAGTVETVVVTLQDLAEVEELERLRIDFLAMVSHELRTPLTSIKGSAAAIMDGGADLDPAVVRQFVRIIAEQTDHMNGLVSDLLDAARIETGTLPVSPEPAEVALLVDRARSAFGSGGGRHDVAVDLEPELPLVLADRRRMVQVLGNLLSNAARNSPQPSVITVSAAREGVHVAVSVSDQGRGIPPESLPHLFRKFFREQTGEQTGEQAGDTGLGLAICKGIVEAHGGRIRAESGGPGLGARFTFTLPAVEGTAGASFLGASPGSTRPSGGEDEAGERAAVLAVDDDPHALRYVRDTLALAGYRPVVTGDPEEALRLMERERPRLALLDLMLPGADGIELMQAILGIADVPVIFISAYGREELIARAFDMGAADYVVKPFSQTELSARIRAALRRRETTETPEAYLLGDLAVDYHRRRATLAGQPVPLAALEYRMLAELSANGGRVLTYQHLLERLWGRRAVGDLRPMRAIVARLRRKLGDDADNPAYVFTQPRVGYWMPQGESEDPA